jgi:hypothetical protein
MARTLTQQLGEASRLAEKYAGIAAFADTAKARAWAGQKCKFWLQRAAALQAALNKEGALS